MSNQSQKYYAIKYTANGNKKDIIVDSWEECSKLVSGYNSIYKSFYTLEQAKEFLSNYSEEKQKQELIRKKHFSKKRVNEHYNLKPMIYKNIKETKVLCHNTYLDYEFYIISEGLFPIALITVQKNSKLYLKDPDYINIKVKLENEVSITKEGKDSKWCIIWDYSHFGDFTGEQFLYPPEFRNENSHKYTTEEILRDVKTNIKIIKKFEEDK